MNFTLVFYFQLLRMPFESKLFEVFAGMKLPGSFTNLKTITAYFLLIGFVFVIMLNFLFHKLKHRLKIASDNKGT